MEPFALPEQHGFPFNGFFDKPEAPGEVSRLLDVYHTGQNPLVNLRISACLLENIRLST